MPISPFYANNFIDSCAFDPKYTPEDKASAQIFSLFREGKLLVQIAHSTRKEIEHPNTPAWVKQAALSLIYTVQVQLAVDEVRNLQKIESILAGNGKVENIRQDAMHIFEAQKYGSYFITTDSRILSRAVSLRSECSVTVLKPSEFLNIVRGYLSKELRTEVESRSSGQVPTELESREDTLADAVSYMGYLIEPASHRLTDSGEWTIEITICRDTGRQIKMRGFSAAGTFKMKDEAIQNCIDFGRQIIDRRFPDCTVSDL